MAASCCNAAQVLHAAGLVHRDFRIDNIVQMQPGSYMVIDLETVSKAQAGRLPAGFSLKDWGPETLSSERRYTTTSDMHQISLLINQLLQDLTIEPSAEAKDCVQQLMNKMLSAKNALKHAWLSLSLSHTSVWL